MSAENLDQKTVKGFGEEWKHFDQSELEREDAQQLFDAYFNVFPWDELPRHAEGFDLGCGTGRWAQFVAPRVGILHCIDPSDAIEVSRRNLAVFPNCMFHKAGVDDMPIAANSMDFGYSLGVLHHVPNPPAALADCVSKLKPGAPFLLYMYYAFDNRPAWYRRLWRTSDWLRRVISRFPFGFRYVISQVIAAVVYWPFARIAKAAEMRGICVEHFPLSIYRNRSFYVLRTDALDRFGTRLEKRFTKAEIMSMMEAAGLEGIVVSDRAPYWCVVGFARSMCAGMSQA